METGTLVAGRYRLHRLLGRGGMAEVWAATNAFTERAVAIKFMQMGASQSADAVARFLKEAKVSARINHPNVIEIFDVSQTETGQLFLVMEQLRGHALDEALRDASTPMRASAFIRTMIDIGDALAAAHRSGIVHRDLKPTNIFMHRPREGVVVPKLLDFGVSKFLEDDTIHPLTIDGTVFGSPLYMSPEQARGEGQLDGRTDIFAFGSILFEGLCGYRTFDAKNFNALLVKIATTRPKCIDECGAMYPEALRAVVRGCLETHLTKRFATFELVTEALRGVLPELDASGLSLPPAAANLTPSRSKVHVASTHSGRQDVPATTQTPASADSSPTLAPAQRDTPTPGRSSSTDALYTSVTVTLTPPPQERSKLRTIGACALGIATVALVAIAAKPEAKAPLADRANTPLPAASPVSSAPAALTSGPITTDAGASPSAAPIATESGYGHAKAPSSAHRADAP